MQNLHKNTGLFTSNHLWHTFISKFPPPKARQPPVGLSLLCEVLRPHSDTPHSLGLFWTIAQLVAETSTWQHTTFTKDRHPCPGGIRTHNPSKREAADRRLRPRGQLHRLSQNHSSLISFQKRFTLNQYKATFTDMRRLTTGIHSEKWVVRRFRRCANVYLLKPR